MKRLRAKRRVPGVFGDDADRQAMRRIGAGVAILDEQLAALDVGEQVAPQRLELRRIDRPVDAAPRDARGGVAGLDDELVVRRAPGMRARPARQRPAVGDQAVLTPHGLFVEFGRRQIPIGPREIDDPERLQLPVPPQRRLPRPAPPSRSQSPRWCQHAYGSSCPAKSVMDLNGPGAGSSTPGRPSPDGGRVGLRRGSVRLVG